MSRFEAERVWNVSRAVACAVALCAGAAARAAEITDTAFSDARFETQTAVVLGAQGAEARPKAALIWVYQSRLGTILKGREPTAEETAELRRICARMHKAARAARLGVFDGYGIEFADGTGDTSRLSPARRVVFFFWDRGACAIAPSRGRIG